MGFAIVSILNIFLYVLGIILLLQIEQKSIIYKYLNLFFITKIILHILSTFYSFSLSWIINLYPDFLDLLGYVNAILYILGCIPYCILILGIYKVVKTSESML